MPNRQGYITKGIKKHPLFLASGIRQQASQLPGRYAQREAREYQDKQIGLGNKRLALEEQGMSMQAKQFKKSMSMQREAADTAKGGMFLKGGLAIGKAAYAEGMFKPGMDKLKGMYNAKFGKQQLATGTNYSAGQADNPTLQGGPSQRSQPSSWDRFSGGGWKSGAWGGVSGGLMGAGAAKALGAKKKWQTAAAGAAGGMASTWMSGGGGNPFSMALGGALGGGLGMLL